MPKIYQPWLEEESEQPTPRVKDVGPIGPYPRLGSAIMEPETWSRLTTQYTPRTENTMTFDSPLNDLSGIYNARPWGREVYPERYKDNVLGGQLSAREQLANLLAGG